MEENIESFENLKDNLKENGLSIDAIPYVLQYNKRDLSDVFSFNELEAALNKDGVPSFEGVATTGVGVFESFKAISKLLLAKLSSEIGAAVVLNDEDSALGTVAETPPEDASAPESMPSASAVPDSAAASEPKPPAAMFGRDPWASPSPAEVLSEPPSASEPVPQDAPPAEEEDAGGKGLWDLFRKDAQRGPEPQKSVTPPPEPQDTTAPTLHGSLQMEEPPEIASEPSPPPLDAPPWAEDSPAPADPDAVSPPAPAADREADKGQSEGQEDPHEIVVPILIPRSLLGDHVVFRLDVRIVQEADLPGEVEAPDGAGDSDFNLRASA